MLFDPARRSDPYDPRDLCYCSHSKLERFRESIPLFHAVHVAKTAQLPESGREARLGSACDVILFTPEKEDAKLIVLPDEVASSRSKDNLALKAEVKAAAERDRRIWLSQSDADIAHRMADACRADGEFRELLSEEYESQKRFVWDCPHTGWPKKGFLDYLAQVILDLKSTSMFNLQRHRLFAHAYNYGVHRQVAMYQEAVEINLLEKRPTKVAFVANEEPYEVVILDVMGRELEAGHDENRRTLRELQDCYDYNQWGSRWKAESRRLLFPRWAYYDRGEE